VSGSRARWWWLASVLVVVIAAGVLVVNCPRARRLVSRYWPTPARSLDTPPASTPVPGDEIEPLTFSLQPQPPAVTPDFLTAGAPVVYVFYWLPDLTTLSPPRLQWWRDGQALAPVPPEQISQRRQGGGVRGAATLPAPDGSLPAGIYEVTVTVGDREISGSFAALWGADEIIAQQPPASATMTIEQIVIAEGIQSDGSPRDPRAKLREGPRRLYLVFAFARAEPGSAVLVKWYANGQPIQGGGREVVLPTTHGWAHGWVETSDPQGLPPAEYRATVMLAGDDHELGAAGIVITP
jgi:hypothetical protein